MNKDSSDKAINGGIRYGLILIGVTAAVLLGIVIITKFQTPGVRRSCSAASVARRWWRTTTRMTSSSSPR